VINPDPISTPMQEGTELAAADSVALEPVGDAAREILVPKAGHNP
jgi:hypothetical protein